MSRPAHRPRLILPLALPALILILTGCFGDGVRRASNSEAAGASRPDECGTYEVRIDLPEQHACTQDADCAWTEHRPGTCNEPVCSSHYRAGTTAWVQAVDDLHRDVCTGVTYRECDRYKCLHEPPTGAVCKEGRCELVYAAGD